MTAPTPTDEELFAAYWKDQKRTNFYAHGPAQIAEGLRNVYFLGLRAEPSSTPPAIVATNDGYYRSALDRAAYALFQLKRFADMPDAAVAFCRAEHEIACGALDNAPPSSITPLEQSERRIVDLAMKRWEVWKSEHPEGLIDWGGPHAMRSKESWELAKACQAHEAIKGEPA